MYPAAHKVSINTITCHAVILCEKASRHIASTLACHSLFLKISSRMMHSSVLKSTVTMTHASSSSSGAFYPHGMVKMPQGVSMEEAIERLGGHGGQINVSPLTQASSFVVPKTVTYKLDGTIVYTLICSSILNKA